MERRIDRLERLGTDVLMETKATHRRVIQRSHLAARLHSFRERKEVEGVGSML